MRRRRPAASEMPGNKLFDMTKLAWKNKEVAQTLVKIARGSYI